MSRPLRIAPVLSRVLLAAVLAPAAFHFAWAPARAADGLTAAEKEAGFVPLFNGVDFTGWRFVGGKSGGASDAPPDNWKVEDGLIKLSGGGKPHLATAREYANFEMIFEWRALKPNYNSGFFVRSAERLGANQLNLAKGAEGKFLGGSLAGAKAAPDLQNPAGAWNEWRVLVEGDKLRFWCNGELAYEGAGLKPDKGYLGLQAEGAALEFRNLRLREIK